MHVLDEILSNDDICSLMTMDEVKIAVFAAGYVSVHHDYLWSDGSDLPEEMHRSINNLSRGGLSYPKKFFPSCLSSFSFIYAS